MVGPGAYAPGAQLSVVKGDPTKEGRYVVRLKYRRDSTEETVLQLHGMGPQGVTYVDPADDAEKVALTANRSRPGQLPPATRRCYGRGAAIDLGETFAGTVQGETSSNVAANISSDRPASTELACPIILDCEVAIAIALL